MVIYASLLSESIYVFTMTLGFTRQPQQKMLTAHNIVFLVSACNFITLFSQPHHLFLSFLGDQLSSNKK